MCGKDGGRPRFTRDASSMLLTKPSSMKSSSQASGAARPSPTSVHSQCGPKHAKKGYIMETLR